MCQVVRLRSVTDVSSKYSWLYYQKTRLSNEQTDMLMELKGIAGLEYLSLVYACF